MLKYIIILTVFHHIFICTEASPLPTEELDMKNIPQEETIAVDKTEDEGWLARIVPEFPDIQLSDYLKPLTVKIPLLTFPELPSYSITLAKK